MRYNKMTASAKRALDRRIERLPIYGDERWRAERIIEDARKTALRASWLDCRNPRARDERSRALRRYNAALATHLTTYHLIARSDLPGEWELDALHEKLHERDD